MNNDDLISRHEAYMLIEREAETHELPATKEAYERAALIVAQMRPANIAIMEPRTGRWEKTLKSYEDEEQAFDYYEITCSECGGEPESEYHLTRFCPSCGAKMEGEAE